MVVFPMKVATWNVNGIRAREAQVKAWIEQEQPDVICLQEIKAERIQVPATLCEMEGYWCYWHGGKGYSGVDCTCGNHSARRCQCSRIRHSIWSTGLSPRTSAR